MDPGPAQPQVTVTPAGPEDAGELLTLQRAAYVTEARIYGDPELPALVQTLEDLRTELGSVTALKATAGHRIVGAVRAHVTGRVLHVGRLTVAPDWQGRGIGSRLLAAVEDHHRGAADTATLFTGHLSAGNLAMYARRGYTEDRSQQLRPGVELVYLTKSQRGPPQP